MNKDRKTLETDFLDINYKAPMYGIFQIKNSEDLRDYWFCPFEQLTKAGKKAERENYDLLYVDKYNGEGLEDIFSKFNIDRPADFYGHSLSVSDIIVIKKNSFFTAYYVDSFGFKEIPAFIADKLSLKYEPTVTIKWSEHDRLWDGQEIPLSEANELFYELDSDQRRDRQNPDWNGSWYYKTAFFINYFKNGEANNTYEGRQDFGDGDGSLISHIRTFYEGYANSAEWQGYYSAQGETAVKVYNDDCRYVLDNFIPYLILHCRFAELDRIASGKIASFEELKEPNQDDIQKKRFYENIRKYVAQCRYSLNYDIDTRFTAFPEHKDIALTEDERLTIQTLKNDIARLPQPVYVQRADTEKSLNEDGSVNLEKIREQAELYQKLKSEQAPDGEYFFAFSDEQFEEGVKRIRETSQEEVYKSGALGLVGTRKGLREFYAHYANVEKNIKEKCEPLGIFYYEYSNHEGPYGDDEAWTITNEYFPDFDFSEPANEKIVSAIKAEWWEKTEGSGRQEESDDSPESDGDSEM